MARTGHKSEEFTKIYNVLVNLSCQFSDSLLGGASGRHCGHFNRVLISLISDSG